MSVEPTHLRHGNIVVQDLGEDGLDQSRINSVPLVYSSMISVVLDGENNVKLPNLWINRSFSFGKGYEISGTWEKGHCVTVAWFRETSYSNNENGLFYLSQYWGNARPF